MFSRYLAIQAFSDAMMVASLLVSQFQVRLAVLVKSSDVNMTSQFSGRGWGTSVLGMISGYGVDVLLTVAKIHPLPLKTQYFIVLISPSEFWGIWFLGCYPLQHAVLDFKRSKNALKIFGLSGNPKHA